MPPAPSQWTLLRSGPWALAGPCSEATPPPPQNLSAKSTAGGWGWGGGAEKLSNCFGWYFRVCAVFWVWGTGGGGGVP